MEMSHTTTMPGALCKAFSEAEDALKRCERISGEIAIPSVNQLRYALCHVLEGDFEAAKNHCIRAKYDAYEAIIGYFLEYIATFFGQKVSTKILDASLPEWKSIRSEFLSARKQLCEVGKLRNVGEDGFHLLAMMSDSLLKRRDEIDSAFAEIREALGREEEAERLKIEQERQDRENAVALENRRRYVLSLWWTVCGTIFGALGLLSAFFR